MKKKILALILAMIMVLGGTGILEVQAAITDKDIQQAVVMTLDVSSQTSASQTVDLAKGETAYFKFTPEVDGVYEFYSNNSMYSYITLYDSKKEIRKDGSGRNTSCLVKCILTAGETYYLEGRFDNYEAGEFTATVRYCTYDSSSNYWYIDYYSQPIVKYGESKDLIVRVWSNREVTYQWYYKDEDYNDILIEGANNNFYTVTGNTELAKGYKCVVTSTDGVQSQNATIYPELYTGLELESDYEEVVVQYGKTKDVTVSASGGAGEIRYQWYRFDEEYNAYPIENETSATLTLTGSLDMAQAYGCEVTDGVLGKGFMVYTYLDTGLRVGEYYKYESFVYGKENTMSMDAIGGIGELSYQWQRYTNNGGWMDISGATESTYTITGEEGDYAAYRCKVTDGIMELTKEYYIEWDTGLKVKEEGYHYINLPENASKTLTVNATGGVGDISYSWWGKAGNEESGYWWSGLSGTTSSYQITANENMKKTIRCEVEDDFASKEVIYEINKLTCTDFSSNAANSVTESEMFFKISDIEGAQSFSFTNNTTHEQELMLYDSDMNELVNSSGDNLTYIFDADEIYYLYVYSEAVEAGDTSVEINHTDVDFYAVADGMAEANVSFDSEHTMRVIPLTQEGTNYQWYYIDENGNENIISEATNDSYTITANGNAHKNYLCKVTNNDDTVDVYFVVNIDTDLYVSAQPCGDVEVKYGGTKVITVDATSRISNLTYQWYYCNSEDMKYDTTIGDYIINNSTKIAGATESSYTLTGNTNLKAAYYCVVSDGFDSVRTKLVYTHLDSGLMILNGQEYYVEGVVGNRVELSIEAVSTSGNLTYKWYYMSEEEYETYEDEGHLISGANSSVYSFIASKTSAPIFKCVVSDGITTKEVWCFVDYYIYGNIIDISEEFTATLEYYSIVEDGKAKTPTVTVKNDAKTLVKDKHYTVEYKNNVKAGTATVIIKGIGLYEGEITKTFTITAKPAVKPAEPAKPSITSISNASVKLAKKSYVFDGKAKKPAVTVVLNGKTLVNGTDYTVTYSNNKKIGKATVTVTGKGKYNGIVKTTFNINIKVGKTYTVGAYKYKVTSKSEVAFAGLKKANTKNVVIKGTVKIGGKKFKITSITNNALKKKTKVKSVTIGANVKKIGKNAFSGCKNLKTITIKSTKLKSVGKNALKGINSKAKIKVPKKKYNAYKKLLKAKGQPKNVKITK